MTLANDSGLMSRSRMATTDHPEIAGLQIPRVSTIQASLQIGAGGTTVPLSISGTSAPTTNAIASGAAVIYLTEPAFVRAGATPVAVANGTDQPIPAETLLRIEFTPGHKLAFITAGGTGTAYITPDV